MDLKPVERKNTLRKPQKIDPDLVTEKVKITIELFLNKVLAGV